MPIKYIPLGVVVFYIVMFSIGCANRLSLPPQPAIKDHRADLTKTKLYINSFKVIGSKSNKYRRDFLLYRFLDYLEADNALTNIYLNPPKNGVMKKPALSLDVRIALDQTTYRTYILDIISLTPYTFGLFTPWWGYVDTIVEVDVNDCNGNLIDSYQHVSKAEFSAVLYGWFRKGYVQEAYQKNYHHAFNAIAGQIAENAPKLILSSNLEKDEKSPVAEPPDIIKARHPIPFPKENEVDPGFRLIKQEPPPLYAGTVYRVLNVLGGLEISGIFGFAKVSSNIDSNQGQKEVASGSARQKGLHIALYSAPTVTGFFWYPTIGYLYQQINISDFRSVIPQVYVPHSTNIEGVCSNPQTGEKIECGAPNTYKLTMKSGYGGLRAGYNLVGGTSSVVTFAGVGGGINLVEYRQIQAKLASYKGTSKGFAFLRSMALGITGGFAFPKAHLAFRFIFDWEYYFRFVFAEPIEFKGPVTYDADKKAFYRKRSFVDDAQLYSWSLQLATAIIF